MNFRLDPSRAYGTAAWRQLHRIQENLIKIIGNQETWDVSRPEISLPQSQLYRPVRQAALTAGLGDGFSGNSGRVGKVLDLSNSGLGIPELMEAGRWKSAVMPARYIKKKDESSEVCQAEALTWATI